MDLAFAKYMDIAIFKSTEEKRAKMNEILDAPDQLHVNPRYVQFGGVVRRVGAFIVDVVILYVVANILSFSFTFSYAFSNAYYFFISISALIVLLYRPLLEGYYGATLGKMIFKLKVVNHDFTKINYGKAFARNVSHISYSIVNVGFTIYMLYLFQSQSFGERTFTGQEFKTVGYLIIGSYLFFLFVDLMVMMNNLKGVSLHDKIAGTYVVKSKTLTSGPREAVYGEPNGKASDILLAAMQRNGIDSFTVEQNASLGLSVQVRQYAAIIIDQYKIGNTQFENHYQVIRELISSSNPEIVTALQLDLFLTLNDELGPNNIFEQQMPESIKREYFKAVMSWKEGSDS